jgi:SWIM zinc finger
MSIGFAEKIESLDGGREACAGKIDSVVELLAGRFDQSVVAHVCRPGTGLFPAAAEITYRCSCPEGWGGGWLCKHVAATLYGLGVRLDEDPEMLFRRRQVTHAELLTRATAALAGATPPKRGARRAIADDRLAAVFGIELETGSTPRARRPGRPSRSVAVTSPRLKRIAPRPGDRGQPRLGSGLGDTGAAA